MTCDTLKTRSNTRHNDTRRQVENMTNDQKRAAIVKIVSEHRYDAFSQDTPVSCVCGKDCYGGKTAKDRIANHIADLILEAIK